MFNFIINFYKQYRRYSAYVDSLVDMGYSVDAACDLADKIIIDD